MSSRSEAIIGTSVRALAFSGFEDYDITIGRPDVHREVGGEKLPPVMRVLGACAYRQSGGSVLFTPTIPDGENASDWTVLEDGDMPRRLDVAFLNTRRLILGSLVMTSITGSDVEISSPSARSGRSNLRFGELSLDVRGCRQEGLRIAGVEADRFTAHLDGAQLDVRHAAVPRTFPFRRHNTPVSSYESPKFEKGLDNFVEPDCDAACIEVARIRAGKVMRSTSISLLPAFLSANRQFS